MKKLLTALLTLSIAVFALAGCGPQKQSDVKMIKVGATAVPHAEILEEIRPMLLKEGVNMEIVEFNDYIQPNLGVNDGELDANFFQHEPYLKNFMEEHNEVKLVNAGGIHVEPMGVYSKKVKSLDEVADGATVAIPNDPTNGGRALLLLQKAGLIQLKDGVDEKATLADITGNPKNLQFSEIEAPQLPLALEDVVLAVINTNYAMQAELTPTKDALFMEDKTSPYVNIVAIRAGDENRPEIKALIKVLQSDKVKKFIEEKYKGAIVPAF